MIRRIALAVAVGCLPVLSLSAQGPQNPGATVLPIRRVVLYKTGVGYFEIGKVVPEIADLNAAISKDKGVKGVKITSLKEVELPKTEGVMLLSISGLG